MNPAISFTNARLQAADILLTEARNIDREADDCTDRARPDILCRAAFLEGATHCLHAAWLGVLNELADTRRLRTPVRSLEDLITQSEYPTEWTERLRQLSEDSQSGLHRLLRAYPSLQSAQGLAPGRKRNLGLESEYLTKALEEMKSLLGALRSQNQNL